MLARALVRARRPLLCALPAAAPALAAAARAAAPAAPARGLAAASAWPLVRARQPSALPAGAPHVFFVKRACDASFAGVEVPAGSSVAQLVKAAMAELHIGTSPAAVTLERSGVAGAPPLDATQTIEEAIESDALAPRAKLLVTVAAHADRESDALQPSLLPYRVLDPLVDAGPQPVSSDADFDAFIRGRTLWAVRD
jgi:hypothetical protein